VVIFVIYFYQVGELDMRKLSPILLATALSTLAVSTLTVTTYAADEGVIIKTSRPPYKPGRQTDDK